MPAAPSLIVDGLTAARPGDGLLGEEGASTGFSYLPDRRAEQAAPLQELLTRRSV
jgi:fructose-1,6-bisphosphatase/inositol monophosphatase family enzyme